MFKIIVILFMLGGIGYGGYYFQENITDTTQSIIDNVTPREPKKNYKQIELELVNYSQVGESTIKDVFLIDINHETEENFGYLNKFRKTETLRPSLYVYERYEKTVGINQSNPILSIDAGETLLGVSPVIENLYHFDIDNFSFDDVKQIDNETLYIKDDRFYQYEKINTIKRSYQLTSENIFYEFTPFYNEILTEKISGVEYFANKRDVSTSNTTANNFPLDNSGENFLNAINVNGIGYANQRTTKDFNYTETLEFFTRTVSRDLIKFDILIGAEIEPSFQTFEEIYGFGNLNGDKIGDLIISIYVPIEALYANQNISQGSQINVNQSMLANAVLGNNYIEANENPEFYTYDVNEIIYEDHERLFKYALNNNDASLPIFYRTLDPSMSYIVYEEYNGTMSDYINDFAQSVGFGSFAFMSTNRNPDSYTFSSHIGRDVQNLYDFDYFGNSSRSIRGIEKNDMWMESDLVATGIVLGYEVIPSSLVIRPNAPTIRTVNPEEHSRLQNDYFLNEYFGINQGYFYINDFLYEIRTVDPSESEYPGQGTDSTHHRYTYDWEATIYQKGSADIKGDVQTSFENTEPLFPSKNNHIYVRNEFVEVSQEENLTIEIETTDDGDIIFPYTLFDQSFEYDLTKPQGRVNLVNSIDGITEIEYKETKESRELYIIKEFNIRETYQNSPPELIFVDALKNGDKPYGIQWENKEENFYFSIYRGNPEETITLNNQEHIVDNEGVVKYFIEETEYIWDQTNERSFLIAENDVPSSATLNEEIMLSRGETKRTFYQKEE